ncbi:MAG: efflux RND transporter periplasmic adaptor subunit, partial [Solimonas sp.]
ATLKNPKRQLLPGMYASIVIDVGLPQTYLTLPQTAITFNPYGETVFVITTAAKLKAELAEKAKQSGTVDPNADAKAAAQGPQPEGDMPVAKQVFVTVGPARGDQVAILKGLKVGDEVVTSGQLKLKSGTAVTVDNKVLPLNDVDPRPTEE